MNIDTMNTDTKMHQDPATTPTLTATLRLDDTSYTDITSSEWVTKWEATLPTTGKIVDAMQAYCSWQANYVLNTGESRVTVNDVQVHLVSVSGRNANESGSSWSRSFHKASDAGVIKWQLRRKEGDRNCGGRCGISSVEI